MALYKKIAFLGIFSLFSFALFAGEKLVLTADKAVEKALEFHVDIKGQKFRAGRQSVSIKTRGTRFFQLFRLEFPHLKKNPGKIRILTS